MGIRTTITFEGVPPLDSDGADHLLDSLIEHLPDAGPVFSQNLETGRLDVVVSRNIADSQLSGAMLPLLSEASDRVTEALADAGLPDANWTSLHAERIADEAPAHDRERALT